MTEKKSSQKASVRHLLAQLFPDAFFEGYPMHHVNAVGEDAIMSARCIGERETIPAPDKDVAQVPDARTYARCLKRTAEWNLSIKDCDYYLMCIDMDALVPATKGEEQGHRDSAKSESELQKEHEMAAAGFFPTLDSSAPYFGLDDPMPWDFEVALKDRKVFRPWLAGWIARQMLGSEDPRLRVDVPEGKMLLMSGHRLTEEDAEFLELEGREGLTDRDRMCTPICITGGAPGDFPEMEYALWARNEIGEGEFQIFTLHRLLCERLKKPLTLDCASTDTDFINLSMIYFEKFPHAPKITWRYAPRQGWIFYRGDGQAGPLGEQRVDFKKMVLDIKTGNFVPDFRPKTSKKLPDIVEEADKKRIQKAFRKLRQPVWYVVSLFVIGGSDFTAGFYGITHNWLFEAAFWYAAYIGDLVKITPADSTLGFRIRLDGSAFVRLIKSTFFLKRRSTFSECDHPEQVSVAEIRSRLLRLAPINRFPDNNIIKLKSAQTTNYLEILAHVGEAKIEEPDPRHRGHYLEDPTKGVVKGNVFRIKS